MNLFIDTSAFFALLDRDDGNHQRAAVAWATILNQWLHTPIFPSISSQFQLVDHG
jgi:predicted nucleic acid-binding protein